MGDGVGGWMEMNKVASADYISKLNGKFPLRNWNDVSPLISDSFSNSFSRLSARRIQVSHLHLITDVEAM